MAEAYKLAQHIEEVIRALPSEQSKEVRHHASQFHEGVQDLEYGVFYKPSRPYERRDKQRRYLHTIFPGIINDLAWNDLEVADKNGFPPLSPSRAMKVSRLAIAYATELGDLTHHDPAIFTQSASGMVGLHASLLGSVELLDDEQAAANLRQAQTQFTSTIVVPLASQRY